MDNNRLEKMNEAWRALANFENEYEKMMICVRAIIIEEKALKCDEINDFWVELSHFVRSTILTEQDFAEQSK